jgi:hypothetical protein
MSEPAWLSALRSDAELAQRFEVKFVEPQVRDQLKELAHRGWEGKFQGELAEAGHARIERSIPVGAALPRSRRVSGAEQWAALWLDPAADQLFAGFTLLFPPALWLPLGQTRASVEAALSPYASKDLRPIASLPRVRRLLKNAAPDERELIEQVCDQHEPWLDDARWANHWAEDPWAGWAPAHNLIDRTVQLREAARERPGRTPSTGCRTLWSGSALTIEYHPFQCIFAVRYAPAPHALPKAELEALAGSAVPTDLPLDLVASLLRAGNISVVVLEALRGSWEPSHTIGRCALEPGEPPSAEELRATFMRAKGDSELRVLVAQLALHYQHHGLLYELACAEPALVRAPDLAPLFAHVLPAAFFEVKP